MRAILTFAMVAAAFGAIAVPFSPAKAADTPSAAQIIQSLTPAENGPITTRGIRLGTQPPSAPAVTVPNRPASASIPPRASSTTMVAPAAVRPAEANLSVPFASGSAEISPRAERVLDQLGQALTSANLAAFRFRVEGHTDTVGEPEANKILSEQRAASVVEYLVEVFGIDRARLTPVGMGQEGLLVETGPQVPSAANRRVLVVNLGR